MKLLLGLVLLLTIGCAAHDVPAIKIDHRIRFADGSEVLWVEPIPNECAIWIIRADGTGEVWRVRCEKP